MRTLTLRLSDGKGNKARNKETRQGKAQQGRESLQKIEHFLKARRRRKGGINPPLPRAPSPLFEERYPPSPHGGKVSGSLRNKERELKPGGGIRKRFFLKQGVAPTLRSGLFRILGSFRFLTRLITKVGVSYETIDRIGSGFHRFINL